MHVWCEQNGSGLYPMRPGVSGRPHQPHHDRLRGSVYRHDCWTCRWLSGRESHSAWWYLPLGQHTAWRRFESQRRSKSRGYCIPYIYLRFYRTPKGCHATSHRYCQLPISTSCQYPHPRTDRFRCQVVCQHHYPLVWHVTQGVCRFAVQWHHLCTRWRTRSNGCAPAGHPDETNRSRGNQWHMLTYSRLHGTGWFPWCAGTLQDGLVWRRKVSYAIVGKTTGVRYTHL